VTDFETSLEQFARSANAWLSPDGDLIPCPGLYQHIGVITKHLEDVDYQLQIIEEVDYICDHWGEDPPDEHPAWHNFEIYYQPKKDDAKQEIMTKAYKQGWVRVGMWRDGVEAEGFETNRTQQKKLKEISEFFDKELVIRSVA